MFSTAPRKPSRGWPAALILAALALGGCAAATDDERTASIIRALVDQDPALQRGRPTLVAGKYAQMARNLFDFYRGSLPLYAADWRAGELAVLQSQFAETQSLPLSLGDAHPENFGLLLAGDDSLGLEPNDFDSVDRYPYLWDLHRLLTGLVLAVRQSNPEDEAALLRAVRSEDDVARAAARAYANAIIAYADGAERARVDEAAHVPALADFFERGERDLKAREELANRTELVGETRVLRRGVLEADEPENRYDSLPDFAYEAIPQALSHYRDALATLPPADNLRLLDAVREFGSGVASWPRERVILLVRGPTDSPDDDMLLELKELSDSPVWGFHPQGVFFDSLSDRIVRGSRSMWAGREADPFWGVSTWLGFPIQIRRETEAAKNIRVARLEDEAGTAQSLEDLGTVLAELLARMHATPLREGPDPATAIARVLRGHVDTFADEQAAFAVRNADKVEADWALFQRALRRRGPTLGFQLASPDAASPDLSAVLGTPEPIGPVP